MKPLLFNKKASAFTFIYVISFAFLLIIMYIIFSQILNVYMYPTTEYLVNATTALNTTVTTAKADKFLGYWDLTPYVLIFVMLLYLFIKSTQKDDNTFQ
jgi:hypothetical protein